ncbi:MAG: cation:proton antiporter [Labilithrix sp.]|nr:cation:proton antiporter [Labilithrix sp.]MCW5815145.1 cation:proton antiporter [Labilithrix sp.]
MSGPRTLLEDLALVLGVAAVTTLVFRRLRQPVVLGYLLAGLIVGPHVPIPLFVDKDRIHTLSELGVVLVMFSVGLEFTFRKLARVLPTSGIVGVIQISTLMWSGYLAGQAFGWSGRESLFAGAMVAISSTMVVAKVFAEQQVSKALADTVFGVLVVQDLAAILLLAVLTALSRGNDVPTAVLARTAGQLGGFLLVLVVVGFLVVPRAIRLVAHGKSSESLLLASIGLAFGFAVIAERVGYSVALGAFVAGALVAESGEAERVEAVVRPVRDVFAAIFFVAVGMLLDPKVVLEHWAPTLALVVVVIVGQIVSVSFGAFLSGRRLQTSIQAGMSLAQIGEFSFIIAGVGIAHGAIGDFLYPVAVAVSVVTTFTTPWLVRKSDPLAKIIDARLPKPLQTFVSLYGTWLDELRSSKTKSAGTNRLFRLLALDALLLAAIIIGAAVTEARLTSELNERVGVPAAIGRWAVLVLAALLSAPFVFGIARIARKLGMQLATSALPSKEAGKLDLAAAPRRALVVTLQLGVVLLVGFPLLAVTQPFISARYSGVVLALVLGVLAIGFWRGATNLHDHVQAGAQLIVEALGRQAFASGPSLHEVHELLPGLGAVTPVRLTPNSPAIGKSLTEINLRALSGASVITIMRNGEGLAITGREPLQAGDVLALAGTQEAIEAAKAMLA